MSCKRRTRLMRSIDSENAITGSSCLRSNNTAHCRHLTPFLADTKGLISPRIAHFQRIPATWEPPCIHDSLNVNRVAVTTLREKQSEPTDKTKFDGHKVSRSLMTSVPLKVDCMVNGRMKKMNCFPIVFTFSARTAESLHETPLNWTRKQDSGSPHISS